MEYLYNYTADIENLCKQYNVKTLYAFGSVLTDRFSDHSDIDLVVDIDKHDPLDYADSYFDFKFALEDLLKRSIDLLEERAIKNPYFRQHLNNSKQLIYAK
ncbi:MAG: nucleotidyltransferase domain-containing protein [Lentimicrobiaceae bacterium]|nr:nucleotidyltransferase domain-containing protein [Lentimicrobiaceae bacterium]